MTQPRVALVTGAARGIGAATVRALVAAGCRVVAVDACLGEDHGLAGVEHPLATRADLDAVADGSGDSVVPVVADVRDREALAEAAALAVERWGRLDVAVAGAAVMAGGRPLWETTEAELASVWSVDTLGVWSTAAVAVPHMLAGPDPSGCRVVAVASTAASRGLFHLAGYTMAKHAVVGLVRGLAADLVGTGVTAVAVSPGATRTPMLDATARLYGLADPSELTAHQLSRRVHEPEEVAATIAHCCSVAGGLLNGSVVEVGGGSG
ncbi:mycofactocin-coupled SDR family oxidoreductase [Nocardioides currus]|uniref:SDR family mycofactocin-dependent oxidoreductase n=1 Tax=Nocardioides currus TaxID=2133958 RepID=A0A2R7YYZ6_9ACTN|nr:mycofactocin-coupled SDR family oxidoreductase [Nocardioides currus]PUA81617.1 SDR family mycofactocin-dependent oxidoreductase [Nocardioides currus]